MRAIHVVILCVSLAACRSSSLGACAGDSDCPSGAACDPAQRVCVATDAPGISGVGVTTPADYTDPQGRAFFDTPPPAVSVAPDSTPYARTLPDGGAAAINVSVTIVDPTGVVSPQLLSGSAVVAPASSDGGVYVFQLDPRDAPAGAEGPYGFHVRALDDLGHDGGADATRVVDDKAPVISGVQVYKDVPDGGGVTYPAAVANTGWTGASFVYAYTVHVQ